MMKYKGYTGIIEIDEEAGLLFGDVIGLRDVITFQGETVAEAQASFRESIDFYLELCAKQGKSPEKPFSGKFLVRVSSELHRAMVAVATTRGISLNALIDQTLNEAFLPPAKSGTRSNQSKVATLERAAKNTIEQGGEAVKTSTRKTTKRAGREASKSLSRGTKAG